MDVPLLQPTDGLKAEVPVCGMETIDTKPKLRSECQAKGRGSRLRDGNRNWQVVTVHNDAG